MKYTGKMIGAILIILLFFPLCVFSQSNWYDSFGAVTGYDNNHYLTGFGISSIMGETPDAWENAKKVALADLASKIKLTIESKTRMTTSEFGEENFSAYKSDISATVSLDLSGIETYAMYFNKNKNSMRYYALCILDKEKMRQSFSAKRLASVKKVESLLAEAKELASKGRVDLLTPKLEAISLALTELSQNLSLDAILGGSKDFESTLSDYYNVQEKLREQIREKEILTESDLVSDIVNSFDWSNWAGTKIAVIPALYKTTEITGEIFWSIKGKIEDTLELKTERLVPCTLSDPNLGLVLKGSYFETKDGWRLIYKLNDIKGNRLLGSHEVDLGPRFVSAQKLAFIPPNIRIATADHDRFVAVLDQPSETNFRAWTSKGSEGVVFSAGETVKFYIQSNKPGYVSCLYHLAGQERLRVPLFQNWRIDASQLMLPIQVDIEFEVTPPFGSETAQFFFSPEPMPQYQTKQTVVNGTNYYVLTGSFDQFLSQTRGMKQKANSTITPLLQTESFITITTVEFP